MLTKIKIDNMQSQVDQMTGMPMADPQQQLQQMPANMQGGRPQNFISQSQQQMGEQMFGGQSLPTPMFMSNKQEEAFGPGSKVYESGNTAIYEGLK
jgi:hypothetical protein